MQSVSLRPAAQLSEVAWGRLCRVCVVHLETVRTILTLLALSYGSATNSGFEWRFEDSSPSLDPLGYTGPRGRVMRGELEPNG